MRALAQPVNTWSCTNSRLSSVCGDAPAPARRARAAVGHEGSQSRAGARRGERGADGASVFSVMTSILSESRRPFYPRAAGLHGAGCLPCVRLQPHGAAPGRESGRCGWPRGPTAGSRRSPPRVGKYFAGALVGVLLRPNSAGSGGGPPPRSRVRAASSARRAGRPGRGTSTRRRSAQPPVLPASSPHSAGKVDSRPRATPVWFDAEARWHRVQAGWFTTPCGCWTICSALRSLTSDSR